MTVYGRGQKTLLDYAGFVEKFKPKKTTDDCITPDAVYEAVLALLSFALLYGCILPLMILIARFS